VLTTHYLEEAEEMCDRIAIIDRGHVVACDDTPDLIGQIDQRTLRVTLVDTVERLSPRLTEMGGVLETPERIVFRFSPSRLGAGEIIAAMGAENLAIADLVTEESDLEDIFIKITGLDEAAPRIAGLDDPEAGGAALARGRPPL